ncbi:cylicin-1-like [Fopius arisanus]|uniref:Cylicin-1-like n=1 Tax=Fopius arisanus TaxID=64838 RepID=A0A9R1T1F7_9HYME|nr:PREDICTED: cylicin-1-like [Fopius arisanus]
MARPQNYPVIYSGNQGMQVRIPAREFPGFNSFYKKGPRPIQPYQPLSSQPQLHFSHQVNNPGKIRNQGEMENDLEGNPVAGRGTPGRDVAFIPSNFGNTHLMTPFTSYSFEVPTSGIFNDYDKTFAKYTPSVLSEVEKEKVDGHSDNSPDSHGNEEENKEKDEKSVTEDQSEEVSASHEQYNDEEGESHNERRGKNSRKREENDHRDKYDKNGGYDFEREFEESYKQKAFEDSETRDADERRKGQERTSSRPRKARRDRKGRDDTPNRAQCHESPSFVSGDSRESSKSDKKRLPGRPTFGHKILHRRPSRFTSHESSDGASSGKSRVSDKSGDFPNQSNRKIPPPSPSQNSSSH